MNWLNKLITRYKQWQRERAVLDTCGCITYCPHCGDILNDNSEWQSSDDDENGTYRCKKCDGVSTWHFGAPVPILVPPNCVDVLWEAARAPAESVLGDAARYRWLREGNDSKHSAAWHVAVNLYGCEWDAAIDAARAAQEGKKP